MGFSCGVFDSLKRASLLTACLQCLASSYELAVLMFQPLITIISRVAQVKSRNERTNSLFLRWGSRRHLGLIFASRGLGQRIRHRRGGMTAQRCALYSS